jgi:predicted  nucleic acid-binding Zn-ribbon protein
MMLRINGTDIAGRKQATATLDMKKMLATAFKTLSADLASTEAEVKELEEELDQLREKQGNAESHNASMISKLETQVEDGEDDKQYLEKMVAGLEKEQDDLRPLAINGQKIRSRNLELRKSGG